MSFFYEILNDGTPYRRKKLRVKRLILTIAAALFMLITLLCSFAIIPSGYTGVRTTFGQIDTVAVSNGFTMSSAARSLMRTQNRCRHFTGVFISSAHRVGSKAATAARDITRMKAVACTGKRFHISQEHICRKLDCRS